MVDHHIQGRGGYCMLKKTWIGSHGARATQFHGLRVKIKKVIFYSLFFGQILRLGMIRSFLSKALQPPEEKAVINALEVLRQLVSMLQLFLLFRQKLISASCLPSISKRLNVCCSGSQINSRQTSFQISLSTQLPWKNLFFTFLGKARTQSHENLRVSIFSALLSPSGKNEDRTRTRKRGGDCEPRQRFLSTAETGM